MWVVCLEHHCSYPDLRHFFTQVLTVSRRACQSTISITLDPSDAIAGPESLPRVVNTWYMRVNDWEVPNLQDSMRIHLFRSVASNSCAPRFGSPTDRRCPIYSPVQASLIMIIMSCFTLQFDLEQPDERTYILSFKLVSLSPNGERSEPSHLIHTYRRSPHSHRDPLDPSWVL